MPRAVQNLVYVRAMEVDLGRRELRSRGTAVALGSRAFEIVEVLARAGGQLVTKDDLMKRIWPGAIVGDNTLHVHVAAVRKAFGSDRHVADVAWSRVPARRRLGRPARRGDRGAAVPPPRAQPAGRPGTNFPVIVTRLVGRSAAVQRVRDLVSAYRVVTLTGPGGIGKTALAMKAVRDMLGDFEDGAWLVELASDSDAALAPSAVAGVLGLKLGGDRVTAEALARGIGDRHLLLLLDNCEHLIDAVAALVETSCASARAPRSWRPAAKSCRSRARPSTAFRTRRSRAGQENRTSSSTTAPWSCSSPGQGHWMAASRRTEGSRVDCRGLPAPRRHPARHRVRGGPCRPCRNRAGRCRPA